MSFFSVTKSLIIVVNFIDFLYLKRTHLSSFRSMTINGWELMIPLAFFAGTGCLLFSSSVNFIHFLLDSAHLQFYIHNMLLSSLIRLFIINKKEQKSRKNYGRIKDVQLEDR